MLLNSVHIVCTYVRIRMCIQNRLVLIIYHIIKFYVRTYVYSSLYFPLFSTSKSFSLSSDAPVEFDFKLREVEKNDAFTVSPMEG